MTSSEPPPGPAGRRRFSGASVALGAVAGFFGSPLLIVVAVTVLNAVDGATGSGLPAGGWLVIVAFLGPLIAAVVVASQQGSPQRRGFALGYAIGWAVFSIVGAGVCVAILQQVG
jgi:hypothetical protein